MPKTLEQKLESNKKYKTCEALIKDFLEGKIHPNLVEKLLENKPHWKTHSNSSHTYYHYMLITKQKPNIKHINQSELPNLTVILGRYNLPKAENVLNDVKHLSTPYDNLFTIFSHNEELKKYINEQITQRIGKSFGISYKFIKNMIPHYLKTIFFSKIHNYVDKETELGLHELSIFLYKEKRTEEHPKFLGFNSSDIENIIRLCQDVQLMHDNQ